MKLALSNLAWDPADDAAVAVQMAARGVTAVEIAPTKVWPQLDTVTQGQAETYRNSWEDRGIAIVAMQALLFGRPDLTVFESDEKRAETLAFLDVVARVGAWLGAKPLVFGSPKNRRRFGQDDAEAFDIASDFFAKAGAIAQRHGTVLCIEPNPVAYACDFVTESTAGRALVEAVGHPGFRLHLDAAGMTMANERPDAVAQCLPVLAHFHASEPQLAPLGTGGVDHAAFAAVLRDGGYQGYVSVEMRPPTQLPEIPSGMQAATEAARVIGVLRSAYARSE